MNSTNVTECNNTNVTTTCDNTEYLIPFIIFLLCICYLCVLCFDKPRPVEYKNPNSSLSIELSDDIELSDCIV